MKSEHTSLHYLLFGGQNFQSQLYWVPQGPGNARACNRTFGFCFQRPQGFLTRIPEGPPILNKNFLIIEEGEPSQLVFRSHQGHLTNQPWIAQLMLRHKGVVLLELCASGDHPGMSQCLKSPGAIPKSVLGFLLPMLRNHSWHSSSNPMCC